MPPEGRLPERTRPSVAVVCWDLGHNALGRAHLLADMLSADHDVEIVGCHFPMFGDEVWRPLRDSTVPIRRYPGGRFPRHFETMERMAAELTADVVYVVKPRLPAMGVGWLARVDAGRGLMVDCDDLELTFVAGDHGITLGEAAALHDHPDFLRPEGRTWTRFCEWAVRLADAVTVSNATLAARYGGAVVPHARDEQVFDPALYDRDEARACLGVGADARVVLFAGTPRRHKGIQQVAAALDRIGDGRNRLCLLATPELEEVQPLLVGHARWVHPVDPPAFSHLPQLLAAADAVCVLQDPASETARWQMPAKITDALAMGVPCLVNPMPPLQPLIDEGALVASSGGDLAHRLASVLDDPEERARLGRRGRELFLDRFSYGAVRPRLGQAVEAAAGARARPPAADMVSTVSFLRTSFAGPDAQVADVRAHELERVHATLRALLPPGAGPVAVVSRGDSDLIRLEGRAGWHFPCTDDGAYAGHHPTDSDAAIEQLEEVRRRGARYLVIPSSSGWWLDHYVGFHDHLNTRYTLTEPGDGIRALIELTPVPSVTTPREEP